MDYYDSVPNDFLDDSEFNGKETLNDLKSMDKGYAKIQGFIERSDGSIKKSKIEIYTTGFIGSNIRNAETGEYYKELVGSVDEDLFFKLKMSDCEVKSKNGSNTLFYISPDHCMRHLNCDIPQNIINKWEVKRNDRLKAKRTTKSNVYKV